MIRAQKIVLIVCLSIYLGFLFCNKKSSTAPDDSGQSNPVVENPAFEFLGIYPGWGGAWPDPAVCEGVDNFLAFEAWLGREMMYVDVNIGDVSWPDFLGSAGSVLTSANGVVRKLHRAVPCIILPLGVKDLVSIDGTYYDADNNMGITLRKNMFLRISSGQYDEYYEQVARDLMRNGAGDAILRLGHEFDLVSYPWSIVGGNHTEYSQAFQHVVTLMRSVLPNVRFCYNWTGAGHEDNPETPGETLAESAYPGDEYVDIIGVDLYDSSPWEERFNQLNYARDMAISHDKPLAIPEWGLWHDHLYPGKPGDEDNPEFIQNMFDYMNTLPKTGGGVLLFHCYFQQLPDHDIFTFPKSNVVFLELFGKVSEENH